MWLYDQGSWEGSIDIPYVFLFVGSLMGGVVASILERRKGRPWLEVLRAHVLFFGIAGFAAAQAFLTGIPAAIGALGFMLPAAAISAHQSRQVLAQRAEKKLLSPPEDSEDPGEFALAQANRADTIEANKQLRQGMTGIAMVACLPIVGIAAWFGSWVVVLIVGVTMAMVGLMTRYITEPLTEANRIAPDEALKDTSPAITLPPEPGP